MSKLPICQMLLKPAKRKLHTVIYACCKLIEAKLQNVSARHSSTAIITKKGIYKYVSKKFGKPDAARDQKSKFHLVKLFAATKNTPGFSRNVVFQVSLSARILSSYVYIHTKLAMRAREEKYGESIITDVRERVVLSLPTIEKLLSG